MLNEFMRFVSQKSLRDLLYVWKCKQFEAGWMVVGVLWAWLRFFFDIARFKIKTNE